MPTGVAGTNVDQQGYIFDPTLPNVIQDYKQMGSAHPSLLLAQRHVSGGFRTVQIPTTQMLTLNTVPIQIVPAAGANTVIIPYLLMATIVYNSATYSCNASGATLIYGANAGGTSTGITISQAFIQSSSGNPAIFSAYASSSAYLPVVSTDVNQPLTLQAASSNPTTGNSDMYVRVYYTVVGVPLGPSSATGFIFP